MRYEIYKDTIGQWRWRFVAANNKIIASGEGYYNKQDCLHAIQLVSTSGTCKVHEL